jgi:hypothetical protein
MPYGPGTYSKPGRPKSKKKNVKRKGIGNYGKLKKSMPGLKARKRRKK